jgi:hypothetical protein
MVLRPMKENALWDGRLLAITPHVCASDFFVGYQPSWGAVPFDPATLPPCLQRRSRPLLWIVNGAGLHAVSQCASSKQQRDARSWPERVLERYVKAKAAGDVLLWQPVGGGLLWEAASRCDFASEMRLQATREAQWLHASKEHALPYDFASVAREYLTLMSDSAHFADWRVPCNRTFPEMSQLVAQLALHVALGSEPRKACRAQAS